MNHPYAMPEGLRRELVKWLERVDGVCVMSVMARGDLEVRPILMTMHNAEGVLVGDLLMQADHMAENAGKCILGDSGLGSPHEYN